MSTFLEQVQEHISVQQIAPGAQHETPFCRSAPAVQAAWSPSSLDTLQHCPRRYQYERIERWKARRESPALWFGSLYHEAIQHYMVARTRNLDHEAALEATVEWLLNASWPLPFDPTEDTARGRFQLLRAVIWYLDDQPKSHMAPVTLRSGLPAVELEFDLALPLVNPDGHHYRLRGLLDQVDRSDLYGSDMIRDRKTTKASISENYLADFKPNNQTAAYVLAGFVIMEDTSLQMLIDICQTQVHGTHFHMHMVSYTPEQLEEWLHNTVWWIKQAERFAEQNYWPMNLAGCDKKGGCPFRRVCKADPRMRQTHLEADWVKLPSVYEIAGFQNFLQWVMV